jgi:hypothetical protein
MTQLNSNVAAALKAIVCGAAVFITKVIASSPVSAGTVAFMAPAGVVTDVQPNNPVNLGLFFTPSTNITVESLGVYYQPQLFTSEQVAVYDATTQALLTSTTVTLTDPITDGYLFQSITPLALVAGHEYVVNAFTEGNPWAYGNVPIQASQITYDTHQYIYTGTLAYPIYTVNAAGSAYYGPNFIFTSSVPEPGSVSMFAIGLALAGFMHYRKPRVRG